MARPTAPGPTTYAYLLNNYWHTNYKADQSGPLSFRFVLAPHAGFDPVALWRLSDEQDFPLLAVSGDSGERAIEAPFMLEGDPIVVASLSRSGPGGHVRARLHNPASAAARVVVRATHANARLTGEGEAGQPGTSVMRLVIPPRGSRTVAIAER